MKIFTVISTIAMLAFCLAFSMQGRQEYSDLYNSSIADFQKQLRVLTDDINATDFSAENGRGKLKRQIAACRLQMKDLDFWFRYFEPIAYRRINGPLPVEWENEVFEKFEPPYRREGAGLTLAEQYLEEESIDKDSLAALIESAYAALATFRADSITVNLRTHHHFFLANRLFLLNLAALYTTGFECPDTSNVIPELRSMLKGVNAIYERFDASFPDHALTPAYHGLYAKALAFAEKQPARFSLFDHYSFIKDYVNPLFAMNQQAIADHRVISNNFNDYTLNNECRSIFDKKLFTSQNSKGVFSLVDDENVLKQVRELGKQLFYDPILSSNNKRSCASCHKPTEYFTDTTLSTALHIDGTTRLNRNIPSLLNVVYNHLVMLDGKLISLQDQVSDVLHNREEMNDDVKATMKKILSCKEYKETLQKLLKYTPEEKEVGLVHVGSAITYYYAAFSDFTAPFDNAMNNRESVSPEVIRGFNLYMSKAQCATCHFVPIFNGVKPPYIGSEFEVIGVPQDTGFHQLSPDEGRYKVNPAKETKNAFRTGTIRNSSFTKPYMHNGVFQTLDQVIDLYDAGGGAGKKLDVNNQTLSTDSLRLSAGEKKDLIAFIQALNENVIFDTPPATLPKSGNKELNKRKVGGEY